MNPDCERCPGCGSDRVQGLVAAFWVPINTDPNAVRWNSESEIGEDRICLECEAEWKDGEQDGSFTQYAEP